MAGSNALLIRGAKQLLTLRGPRGPRRGAELQDLGLIADGAVLIRDGIIEEVGPARRVENLAAARGSAEIDAKGRVVMPGFVDSHTHLVFPPRGPRGADEETAARTMRASSAGLLLARTRPLVEAMARHGATTVEVKTGSGLDDAVEVKTLRVLSALNGQPIDVVPTFLLRVPQGVSDQEAQQIASELPPRVLRRHPAAFADIWWDGNLQRQGAYSRYLERAGAAGVGVKVHASGPGCAAAVAMAIGQRGVSVDHLEHITHDLMPLLANSRTVATLMPGAALESQGPVAPARSLISAGVAIALASDFNPHRTPTLSMQIVISLACLQMRMTPAEAIAAATINGAHALGRATRTGSIEPGKDGDLVVLELEDYRDMPRYFGANMVQATIKRGVCIYREGAVRRFA